MKTNLTILILFTGLICAEAQNWTWSEDQLTFPRIGLSAAVLDDSIFFSGGALEWGGPYSTLIEIFNVGEGTWSYGEPTATGRWQSATIAAGGKVFIAGGNNYEGGTGYNLAEIDVFSKETGEWTLESLSQGRFGIGAIAYGNKVFFAGGAMLNMGTLIMEYTDVIDIYDLETDTWSTDALSVARGLVGAAAAGGKVFFAGGATGENAATDIIDVYEVSTGEWTVEYLSEPRAFVAAIDYDSLVFFAGGVQPNGIASPIIDVFNVQSGEWEDLLFLWTPRIVNAMKVMNALVFAGNINYMTLEGLWWIGGANGVTEIFYPETGQWDYSVPDLDPPRKLYGYASYGNKAYLAGGDAGGAVSTISILELTTGVSSQKLKEAIARVSPNPFTSDIRIDYNLQQPDNISIIIYNHLGEKIEVLLNEVRQQGDQHINFNATKLPSGIYFCVLKTNEGLQTIKLIKLNH